MLYLIVSIRLTWIVFARKCLQDRLVEFDLSDENLEDRVTRKTCELCLYIKLLELFVCLHKLFFDPLHLLQIKLTETSVDAL